MPDALVELLGRRTRASRTYRTADGQLVLHAFSKSLHYLTAQGLQDINPRLEPITDARDPQLLYQVTKGYWQLYLYADGTVRAIQDGREISFQLRALAALDTATKARAILATASFGEPVATDDRLTWPDVFPGVDYEIRYHPDRLEERIVFSAEARAALDKAHGAALKGKALVLAFDVELGGDNPASEVETDGALSLARFGAQLAPDVAFSEATPDALLPLRKRLLHTQTGTLLLTGCPYEAFAALPAGPVVIDPTTDYLGDTSDGFIYGTSTTYSTARAGSNSSNTALEYLTLGQVYSAPNYLVYRAYLAFDTSGLPDDALIEQVNLSLKVKTNASTTDFDVAIYQANWTAPLGGDARESNYDLAGTLDGVWKATADITTGQRYTSANLDTTYPSKTGTTKYMLKSSRDVAGNTPTGNEYIDVYSADRTGAGDDPILQITYSVPLTDNQPSYLVGWEDLTDAQPGYLFGHIALTGEQPCYLASILTLSGEQPAYLGGVDSLRDAQPCFLHGPLDLADSQPSYLRGWEDTTDNQPGYIGGHEVLTLPAPAYLYGHDVLTDEQVGYLHGHTALTDEQTAYLHGFAELLDAQPAYQVGHIAMTDAQPCYVGGKAVTYRWQVYAGTPAWRTIAEGERLILSGSARNLAVPVRTRDWQDGTHLGSAYPGVDKCGVSHVPNVRYESAATGQVAGSVVAMEDANVPETVCLRLWVQSTEAQAVTNPRFFVYDVFSQTRAVPGIEVQGFARDESASAWTQLGDGANVGGDNAGERLDLADREAGTDHYFYLALSARVLADTALPVLNIGWRSDDLPTQTLPARLTYTTGEGDYELWVLDSDHQRAALIDDITSCEWQVGKGGESNFTFNCHFNSHARAALATYDLIRIRRGGCDLLDGRIEKPEYALPPEGLGAATVKISGRGLTAILDERQVIPAAGDDAWSYTGRPDDAMKDLVGKNFVLGIVPDANRVFSGLTCQPARSEAPLPTDPDEQTYEAAQQDNVLEFLRGMAEKYDVDFEVRADGEGNLSFETYYPRLGVDRSDGNTEGNREVVLAVTRENLSGIRSYKDMLRIKNYWYIGGFGKGANRLIATVSDDTSIATHRRREAFLDCGGLNDTDKLEESGRTELAINGNPVTGIEITFQQTTACKFGRDVQVGDKVSVFFEPFDVNLDDDWEVVLARGRKNEDGQEVIELVLGRVEPTLQDYLDEQSRGGSAKSNPQPLNTPTYVYPDVLPDIGDGKGYALDNHRHGMLAAAPTRAFGITAVEGVSTNVSRSDHGHDAFDGGLPADVAAAAAAGSSAKVARRDHVHKGVTLDAFTNHQHGFSGESADYGPQTHTVTLTLASQAEVQQTMSGRTGLVLHVTGETQAGHDHSLNHCHTASGTTAGPNQASFEGHTHNFTVTITATGGERTGAALAGLSFAYHDHDKGTLLPSPIPSHGHSGSSVSVSDHAAHKHGKGTYAVGAIA